jgi:2',3'-cyclic-nucleotide 2'-phosphodiesterase / 3'-nucleotidase
MRILTLLLAAAALLHAERVSITVLATTDMHGNIYPVDYFTQKPVARGLAKMASLIAGARREAPHSLLIDVGDTIQGTPLEYVYQAFVRTGHGPLGVAVAKNELRHDPMMLAMNRLGYDAMAVGNHEYNFGLKCFNQARADAQFPWLSANTTVAPGGKEKPFAPYIVKTVAGVKVAVIGITTPAVPTWEKPENLGAYRFQPAPEAVQRTVAELRAREKPDVIVVAAHAGLGRDLKTGSPEEPFENAVYGIATAAPDIDAIAFGHSHRELAGARVGNVLLVQGKNGAASLARIDFTLERETGGAWKVVDKRSRLIPVTDQTPADPGILEAARPYHEAAERYLNLPVATAPRDLDAALGRVEDNPLVDAVQQVQLFYTHADVSLTALFNPHLKIAKGPVTVRQIAALYPYENVLYVIAGTGKMLKDALENAARYYVSCEGERCAQGPLVNPRVAGFNFDVAQGVEYAIDLGQPEGGRIRNLRWHGQPLAPEQPLKLAINNYRAAGSAGYGMFRGAKVLWHSEEEIRDLIVRYFSIHKVLPVMPDGNWRVLPEVARRTLEKQALEYAHRPDAY